MTSHVHVRAVVRVAFILLTASVAVVTSLSDLLIPWQPYAAFGFSANRSGDVTWAGQAAQGAGLHAGDRIDFAGLTPAERLKFAAAPGYMLAPVGTTMRLPLESGQSVTVTARMRPRTLADNVTDVIECLALLLYIVVAAGLVLLRPSPVTWAFYAFSYSFCNNGVTLYERLPFAAVLTLLVYGTLTTALSSAAFMSFALRFPDVRLRGPAAIVERGLLFVVAPLLGAFFVATEVAFVFAATLVPAWAGLAAQLVGYAVFGAGIVVLLARYAFADREIRSRLQWIVAAFSVAYAPNLLGGAVEFDLGISLPVVVANLAIAWTAIAPLALAYTVLRHRLFDIRFVFSRALVYATVTSIAVAVLALVDWIFAKWLEESRFALLAELALALLAGFALTTIHRRVERAINAVIFRAQAAAFAALRRFAREVDLIADPNRLIRHTFEVLRARVEAEYAAIYTADGSSLVRATPLEEAYDLPPLLANDDLVVLRLRRWSEPFECDEPKHPLRGALLLPMTARAQLVGFLACGPKRDRTHYLPAEVEALSTLAHRTGSAYAWLTLRDPETFARPSPASDP
ncbi:MAG TPA: hypothetical protein VMF61_06360 [Candidatus Acidoferrales bacterium]|nr:hypothetical protein [Candidatus Acidoferrales bacterium]